MRRTTSLVLLAALSLSPLKARADGGEADASADAEDAQDQSAQQAATFLSAFPPHRFTYVVGAGFLVGALAFSFAAQGEAKRSQTVASAVEAQNAVTSARAAAATSSVMYGLAGATLVYALLLEFLPEPVAEKASLTFHF